MLAISVSDPCASSPCHKLALCVIANGGGGFTCLCPDGLRPKQANTTNSQVRLSSQYSVFN